MTSLLDHPTPPPRSGFHGLDPAAIPVGSIGTAQMLAGIGGDLTPHAAHLGVHGPLPRLSRDRLLAELDQVALAIRALRSGSTPAVVVNGAEGEPASAKDHVLLARAPHLVLDGATLLADAVGAPRIVVAVTDPRVAQVLATALASRPDGARFEVRLLASRFLAGEAHALISALNGGNGLPPGRQVHATARGLDGAPTLLFNAETCAQLAVLARSRPDAHTAAGTAGSPVTTLLTVSGAVASPGVLEVPCGVELGQVLRACGAAPPQAVVLGGYHGTWLAPDPTQRLSVTALAAAGGTFGAGVVAVLGLDTCPLAELTAVAAWLAGESARQCGPCAFGLPALAEDLTALLTGRTPTETLGGTVHRHAQQVAGRGACAHPDGAARFITTALSLLNQDISTHQAYGTCRRPHRGHLALTRAEALTPRTGH